MLYKKHFSLNEARTLIPFLKEKLSEIRKLSLELNECGFDIYKGKYRTGFHPDTNKEFPDLYDKMRDHIGDIYLMGIEIKGIEQGLIDFPALRKNGEEVFLCWKLDETDIEFWHRIDDGFQGRRHIDDF